VTLAPRCARLVDVEAGVFLPDRTVVVEGERIRSVRPGTDPVPDGVEVLDLGDATLRPGLIDLHTHLAGIAACGDPAPEIKQSAVQQAFESIVHARDTLHAGFTAVRYVGTYRASSTPCCGTPSTRASAPPPDGRGGRVHHGLRRRWHDHRARPRHRPAQGVPLRLGAGRGRRTGAGPSDPARRGGGVGATASAPHSGEVRRPDRRARQVRRPDGLHRRAFGAEGRPASRIVKNELPGTGLCTKANVA
jgi:hypothetical protein